MALKCSNEQCSCTQLSLCASPPLFSARTQHPLDVYISLDPSAPYKPSPQPSPAQPANRIAPSISANQRASAQSLASQYFAVSDISPDQLIPAMQPSPANVQVGHGVAHSVSKRGFYEVFLFVSLSARVDWCAVCSRCHKGTVNSIPS